MLRDTWDATTLFLAPGEATNRSNCIGNYRRFNLFSKIFELSFDLNCLIDATMKAIRKDIWSKKSSSLGKEDSSLVIWPLNCKKPQVIVVFRLFFILLYKKSHIVIIKLDWIIKLQIRILLCKISVALYCMLILRIRHFLSVLPHDNTYLPINFKLVLYFFK